MSAAVRLNAPPHESASGGEASASTRRTCLECGGPQATSVTSAEFCCSVCRMRWHNRRQSRGVEVYDLLMALRWDRPLATGLRLMTALSRAAAFFRREDIAEREGRRSWDAPERVLERRPYLRAEKLAQLRAGRR